MDKKSESEIIENAFQLLLGILLEKGDGTMMLQNKKVCSVSGFKIEFSAKIISVPFPEIKGNVFLDKKGN